MGKLYFMDSLGCLHIWTDVDDYFFEYDQRLPKCDMRECDIFLQYDYDIYAELEDLDEEDVQYIQDGYPVYVE